MAFIDGLVFINHFMSIHRDSINRSQIEIDHLHTPNDIRLSGCQAMRS